MPQNASRDDFASALFDQQSEEHRLADCGGDELLTPMPPPPRVDDFASALFDQQSEEHRIADWGGDELFTRMPRPPRVDDAPAPRFRPSLTVVDQPVERRRAQPGAEWTGESDRRRGPRTAVEAAHERAERLGIEIIDADEPEVEGHAPAPDTTHRAEPLHVGDGWDRSGDRPTKVITGRPDDAPRPLPMTPAERRRAPRSPAEFIGPRPERIMAWAFALGLLLILIAITTADAATL